VVETMKKNTAKNYERFDGEWMRNSLLHRLQSLNVTRWFWMSIIIILFICVILMCARNYFFTRKLLCRTIEWYDIWGLHGITIFLLGWETMWSGRSFLIFLGNFGDLRISYVRCSIHVIGLVLTAYFMAPICSVGPPSSFDPHLFPAIGLG
jgi:hypothetical protein